MSKQIEWSEYYGVGEIVCTCDECSAYEKFDFDDNSPDFKEAQSKIKRLGWTSLQVQGKWKDFCCEECRNDYIRHH